MLFSCPPKRQRVQIGVDIKQTPEHLKKGCGSLDSWKNRRWSTRKLLSGPAIAAIECRTLRYLVRNVMPPSAGTQSAREIFARMFSPASALSTTTTTSLFTRVINGPGQQNDTNSQACICSGPSRHRTAFDLFVSRQRARG